MARDLVSTIRESKQKKDDHKGASVKDVMTADKPAKDKVRVNVDGKYSHIFKLDNTAQKKK